jgi:hypothetical protein
MRPYAVLAILVVTAGLAGGGAGAADLIADPNRLQSSWSVSWELVPADDCAIVEGCLLRSGYRKLLRFSTETANLDMVDLYLGDPATNPLFEFSPCHGHYHFGRYAEHQLLDGTGTQVAPGFKTGFCLLDSRRYINQPWVPLTPRYSCSNQGLQRGWSDVYGSGLDCQWVDVTDVPNGSYTLQVTVNPDKLIEETNYDNNVAQVSVTVGDPPGIVHRPNGANIPGAPLLAERQGSQVRVTYDVSFCPALNYNLYYGLLPPSTYVYTGAFCNLGTDGQETVALPDPPAGGLVWFVVVGRSGSTEGGHGFDSSGVQRPLTGQGLCSITTTRPAFGC